MTLNEMIVAALSMLDRGQDAQTVETYRNAFTLYANEAMYKLARAYQPRRTQRVKLAGHCFSLGDLERECLRVMAVRQGGRPVYFNQDTETGRFVCRAAGEVEVTYCYLPQDLSSTTDAPELPESMHRLIPEYIVARHRSGGDPDTQGAFVAYYQEFNAGLGEIQKSHYGQPDTFLFKNQW